MYNGFFRVPKEWCMARKTKRHAIHA